MLDLEHKMSTEINILLLGESGSGKSTTLNALENYLKFPTFEKAIESLGSISHVVPFEFFLPDPTTSKPKSIKSPASKGDNDLSKSHNPTLPSVVEHVISYKDFSIRIIRMPTLKSTTVGEKENDKNQFESFKKYLKTCPKLDAIIFIVKCNESHLSPFMQHCITELTNSSETYSKNIMFCFTFSSATLFGAGEGFNTLGKATNNTPTLISGVNSFFIDNVAYRLLIASKQNYPADLSDASCEKYWNNSAKQIELMMDCILQIAKPNVLQNVSITKIEADKAAATSAIPNCSASGQQATQSTLPEINILLLGETGAGKSTTLNALANYLKYVTFQNALEQLDKFTEEIPSQFNLPDPETGESMLISTNKAEGQQAADSESNELHSVGSSGTISTMGYTFEFKDYVLRIIDTPGIGDTAGVEKDKKNFENIMSYLQYHQNLNAVVFVVNGDKSRKTAFFKYCITELLTYLHKDLCKNFMFCFTHSRNSMYGAGEGYATLKDFFDKEIKEVKIKLTPKQNCFFIDNEAYRFMVAKKCGYKFPDFQSLACDLSWNHSTQEITSMMECIMKLPPHNLQQTISLNNARKIILELAQPMVEMQKNIANNIERIQEQERMLSNSNQSKKQLEKLLRFEVEDLRMKALSHPSTVCTNCVEEVKTNEGVKIHYSKRCHEACWCNMFVVPNMPNQHMLKFCNIMRWNLLDIAINCRKCSCNWKYHMYMTAEYEKVKRTVIDKNVKHQIQNQEKEIKQISAAKHEAQQLLQELDEELKVIQKLCSEFSYILSSNANLAYNAYFEYYLNFLIEKEKRNPNSNHLRNLETMKSDHKKKVRLLNDAIANRSRLPVLIDDVPNMREQLLALKHSGPQFSQILNTNQAIKNEQFKYWDKKVAVISEENVFSKLFKKFSKMYLIERF